MTLLKRFWKEEAGLETVEWAILAAVISGGVIVAAGVIGGFVQDRFTTLQADIEAS